MKQFSILLKNKRKKSQMTQRDLAREMLKMEGIDSKIYPSLVDCEIKRISRWESCTSSPRYHDIWLLCNVLDLSYAEIFETLEHDL